MSIATEITRIASAVSKIKSVLTPAGITTSTDKIDGVADKLEANFTDRGAVQASVKEGETYTIPKGWHNGAGTVIGAKGGGNYTLQSKTVTPTKAQQDITSDDGYYGLSGVIVNPIPSNFADISSVTSGEGDVLATKVFVDATGAVKTGTMVNRGKVTQTLDRTTTSYTIPAGYHNGEGTVNISLESQKSITPSGSEQTVSPSTGKLLSTVKVAAIPAKYIDASSVDATASQVLSGKYAVVNTTTGNKVAVGTLDMSQATASAADVLNTKKIAKLNSTGDGVEFVTGTIIPRTTYTKTSQLETGGGVTTVNFPKGYYADDINAYVDPSSVETALAEI